MSAADDHQTRSAPRRVAVAGNPNSGKSTLFNALTGLRQKVGNYPGVTVERHEGRFSRGGVHVTLMDLPGIYSLSPRSPDESVARDALLGRLDGLPAPDAVLIVVDASNLERNLYLATQILDLGLPAVIACNMMDLAEQKGDVLDTAALSAELGVPVVATVGTRRQGVDAVRDALASAGPRSVRSWPTSPPIEAAVALVSPALMAEGVCAPEAARGLALLLLGDASAAPGASGRPWPESVRAGLERAREALLRDGMADPAAALAEARYAWIGDVVARTVRRSAAAGDASDTLSDRIDRVVTHKIGGTLVFAGVMFAMFMAIFSWAEPLMAWIEAGQEWLQRVLRQVMPAGPLADLLADGVIGGAGAVVVFLPQICILFLFIALLEDSGYMARAAFVMDRLMSAAGLHGKSFIPLLSSFACAVPGILATRTIESPRDRLATILVAPLMSCSARLPVYLTIIAAVFPGGALRKASIIFGMYMLGTVVALLMAALLKRTLLRGPTPTFILELPPYHLPRPVPILRAMWDRSALFLTRAGTIIVAVCVVLWALAYFPRDAAGQARAAEQRQRMASDPTLPPEGRAAAERVIAADQAAAQLRQSALGRTGRAVEPLLAPLGFDWRLGVGVLASFAAREVFVSTMGVVFSAGSDDEVALRQRLSEARWESGPRAGRALLSPAAGLSMMVFYALCCQCASTLATIRRETGGWGWPSVAFGYMTALAYVAALLVFQIGSWFGYA